MNGLLKKSAARTPRAEAPVKNKGFIAAVIAAAPKSRLFQQTGKPEVIMKPLRGAEAMP
jgi:hypothetical protein